VEQQPPQGPGNAENRPPRRTRNPRVWALVGTLLLIPTVMPLLVPIYAREEPSLLGFPFFFWYQFLWIILAATMTTIAFRVVSAQERRDRESRDRREGGASR
jgi:Protein of unknown function (DUF3311)